MRTVLLLLSFGFAVRVEQITISETRDNAVTGTGRYSYGWTGRMPSMERSLVLDVSVLGCSKLYYVTKFYALDGRLRGVSNNLGKHRNWPYAQRQFPRSKISGQVARIDHDAGGERRIGK